jgi:HPt (histidine-containing phosphotransfer) domain-containing protein
MDGDEAMVQEVVERFLADCPRLLDMLRTALRARAFDAAALAAHSFRGALLALAAAPAADAAARLEHAALSHDITVIEVESHALESELDTLCTSLVGVTEVV